MGRIARKWLKHRIFGPFLPFFGLFSAQFPGEARSHFSAIFARFRAEGPKAASSRSVGPVNLVLQCPQNGNQSRRSSSSQFCIFSKLVNLGKPLVSQLSAPKARDSLRLRWRFFRDGETTIKINFWLLRGGGLGAERKIVQKRLFSWETPRQSNFESENLIVENFCCHCAGS